MKKNKKQKVQTIILHQHKDLKGHLFGKLHPIDANHSKTKTQKAHDWTIK